MMRFLLRRTSLSSSQISEIVSMRGRKVIAATRPLRVVVSYDHVQAVKKHYVRAGGT